MHFNRNPEILEYPASCLIEFLDDEGVQRVVYACGPCSVTASCDADGITTVISGECSDEQPSQGFMTISYTD